jgi:hypothetical protein
VSRRPSLCLAALAALALAAGCEEKKASAPDATSAPLGTIAIIGSPPPADASPPPLDASAEAGGADACADTSTPRAGKSMGHTSVVFKLELSSGKKVAWKPNARKVKGRYKGEIAAFRFAEALGIHNVPPACARAFDAPAVATALAPNAEAAKVFADEAIVEQGKVHGAVIPWIDGLEFWPLEKEPLRSEARAWLTARSAIPEAKVELARQTSTLIAFDFMTGNWDRYSGENVGIDKGLVLYIDNDAAFMEAPPKELVARNKKLLGVTERFSRSFIARVRALDEDRIAAALGDETPGRPLVSRAVVALVTARAKELVSAIDAKIAVNGEAETLYFR